MYGVRVYAFSSALLWDIGKGHGVLGAGAAGGCEPPGVVLGTRSQVLEEQYPLLTDRPFITLVPSLRVLHENFKCLAESLNLEQSCCLLY